jgi:hypothetical protein
MATSLCGCEILLERAQELSLLDWGLVSTVTELGRSVDPFELDLLQGLARCVVVHRLSESHDTLLDTWHRALEEDEVVFHLAVADETTHASKRLVSFHGKMALGYIRSDSLVDDVEVGGSILLILALADAVDLVVARGTMMIAILASTTDGPLDVRWMPCTDTGNLSETLVRLSRQLLGTPSAGDTAETVAFGDGNAVDHLILLKDGIDLHGLLEHAMAELNLVCDAASVDLDLHEVSFLLLERCLADLGVGEDTDDGAVLANALEFTSDRRSLVL